MKYFVSLILILLLSSCWNFSSDNQAILKNDKAIIELNAGNLDQALVLFKEALSKAKSSLAIRENILRNIAQTYIELDIKDSAIHYSTLAANCFKSDTYEYLVNMADVDIMMENFDVALERLNVAYSLKPNDIAVNNALGIMYLGEYDIEFEDLEKALQFNKKAFENNRDKVTETVLAKNYYYLEQYEKAEKHYSNISKKYPDDLETQIVLGMVKFKLNNKEEAEQIWDNAKKIDSSYTEFIDLFKQEN